MIARPIRLNTLWNPVFCIFRYKLICLYCGSQLLPLQKEAQPNLPSVSRSNHENWGESSMADGSPRTDTSTDDTEDKNQRVTSLGFSFQYLLLINSGSSRLYSYSFPLRVPTSLVIFVSRIQSDISLIFPVRKLFCM